MSPSATSEIGRGARAYREAFLRGLRPEPRLTVSEWADQHRYLSTRSGPIPGPWRTSRTPYLREIMDALSVSSPVQEVVFCKGSQIGGTELGNNWLGSVIHQTPGSFMVVMPTEKVQKRKSRQSLDTLIRDTPVIRNLVHVAKSRDPGNTTLMKVFPGGILILASAESASDLRSSPVRFLFKDEIDAFPEELDGEGDPDELADRGTMGFGEKRKIYSVSTPTIEGRSRIMRRFLETDRRYYHVPCPRCGFFQRITWRPSQGTESQASIKWESHPDELPGAVANSIKNRERAVWMECGACQGRIDEHEKETMLPGGRWVPEAPERSGVVRGYHLSALYSPYGMYSWADSAYRFLRAKGDPKRQRVWTNQDLGETWKETGEAPDWRRLWERRESYPLGIVPLGGRILTCGVDVQGDRIELEVKAWGPERRSWSIEYLVFPGGPEAPATWTYLDRLLARVWQFEDGGPPQHLAALGIDAGFAPQLVYAWVRRYGISARLFALRGRVGTMQVIGPPSYVDVDVGGRKIQRGASFRPVDTGMIKEELFGRLSLDPPTDPATPFPEGYCHFPSYGVEYFKGLASEQLIRRRLKSGREVHDWEKLPNVERNEPLDCYVYARAVLSALGADAWELEDWDAVRTIDLGGPSPSPPTAAGPAGGRERSTRWRRAGPR